ncbi:helix-turn-helix transcriptional regulator [Desertimonas flava]|uniref:helix-turn-helix transcriptional regulator n=1 Tax=Desertimonas flava TaxID=2064846 RepID=UPI000E35420F
MVHPHPVQGQPGERGPDAPEPLLERAREWSALTSVLDAVGEGRGGMITVTGPAGIGKTRLVVGALREAKRRGFTVLSAVGGSLEQEFAYGAVRQLFDTFVARSPGADALFADGAAAAAALFGRSSAFDAAEAAAPGAVLHGLYWLTVAIAESPRPLVLVCDDVHWFDPPSLRFLSHLAPRAAEIPVAIVVGSRPPVPGPDGEVLRRLLAHPDVVPLTPAPLSPIAVAELVGTTLAPSPVTRRGGSGETADFCDVVVEQTGGNPFLVGELLKAASRADVTPDSSGARRLRDIDAAGAVVSRIGNLSSDALEVARSVAVLGADAHVRHVAALTGRSPDAVGEAADALLIADVLRADRPLAFVHPLVEDAVYRGILPGDRSSRHRAAAQCLRAEGAGPERIARHLMVAEPVGDPDVVDVLDASARIAIDQGATDVAIAQLRRALAEPASPERALGIALRLGAAESFILDPGAIEHLGLAVQRLTDPKVRVQLATARAVTQAMHGRAADAVADLDALAAELPREPALHLALVAAHAFVGTIGPVAAGLVRDRVAELMSLVTPESDADPSILGIRAYHGACLGEPADDVAYLAARALASLDSDGGADPMLPVWFHLPLCALVMADRDDDAATIIDRHLTAARRRGAPALVGIVLFLRALIAFRAGDLDDAATDAQTSLDLAIAHRLDHLVPGALAVLVDVVRERDDLGGAEALLADHGYDTGDGDSVFHLFLLFARGRLHGARERWNEAFADLERGLERSQEAGIVSPGLVSWRVNIAFASFLAGRLAEARELARVALDEAERFGAPRPRAEAHRLLVTTDGTSGTDDGALVVSEFAKLGARLEEARTLLSVARSPSILGTPEEQRLVAEALQIAERCGATRLVSIASSTLRGLGASRKLRPMSGVGALTASERRTSMLAAAGRTNREIAEELFVSVKTVETHLAHTYQKLGITSRSELSSALRG